MEQVRVGIVGLGRLGKIHGQNLAYQIPKAKLCAACSIVPQELEFAKTQLGVQAVYGDYREMLEKAEIDAVVIVTTSSEHCWQIASALDAGKHVFCDKPLGVDVRQCLQAEAAVKRHPELAFMLGFMRRYDKSYAYAKQKIEAGEIGVPYMVKATGVDPEALAEGAIRFAKTSGGIFLDMAIHDIDLMRWFLGCEATEVYALGATFRHPGFREAGDDETGAALYRFENGGIGIIHVGRTAPHGYHVETEVIGTEGSIRISAVPEKNLAMLFNSAGAVTECVESFPERFEEAYLLEMREFIDCVRSGRKPGVSVSDGTKATVIGCATTEAWKKGALVKIQ